ncbi:phosphate-starvation-inducible PsiE family protein [Limisalsivibrio acetivorans]|uniref:phosphate-starvation-inducible PsiE family protein n=1 Tax=Limisalsivibrio acetivorans TaxID=1304888 RepID=UPI0003B78AEB|nr:phosphate-starvation-inducible PsiE family protein [Limisalsivibrio acetivorans]
MKYYRNLKNSYDVTEKDLSNISSIAEFMEQYREDFIRDTYENFISRFTLPDKIFEDFKEHHQAFLGAWYDRFFEGKLNNNYLDFLARFGKLHTKFEIETEWITSMLSYIRLWIHEKIFVNMEDDIARKAVLLSMHKLIDINNDVIGHSYYESKMKRYTSLFSMRNFVVGISEQFSLFMHMVLVTVLMVLTVAATIYFGHDILELVHSHSDKVLLTALGSLLIIWVLVELLHTEVQIIKGGKFKISVFVGVALIAFIRDLLIITLKHEAQTKMTYMFVLASILILGFIYWLIGRTEK